METLKIINRLTALLPNDDGGSAGGCRMLSAAYAILESSLLPANINGMKIEFDE